METQYVSMAIPNHEIRYIYRNTISSWFYDKVKIKELSALYQAMLTGDVLEFQDELSAMLRMSISYMDSREAFCHGFVLGVLGKLDDYLIRSNREAGSGRLDIAVLPTDVKQTPVILELKIADTFKDMDNTCGQALGQIIDRQYFADFTEEGYHDAYCYGIAFFRKQCRMKMIYMDDLELFCN